MQLFLTHLCSGLLLPQPCTPCCAATEVLSPQIFFLLSPPFFSFMGVRPTLLSTYLCFFFSYPVQVFPPITILQVYFHVGVHLLEDLHWCPLSGSCTRTLAPSSAIGASLSPMHPVYPSLWLAFVNLSILAPSPELHTDWQDSTTPEGKKTNSEGSRPDRNIVLPMCKCGPTVPHGQLCFRIQNVLNFRKVIWYIYSVFCRTVVAKSIIFL